MIIADALLVIFVACLIGWVASLVVNSRRRALAMRVPPSLGSRSGVEMSQAGNYYRIAKRMAHELAAVLMQDEYVASLPDKQRASIQRVLDEWESM